MKTIKKILRLKHRGNRAKASSDIASHSPSESLRRPHSLTTGPASQIGGAKKIESSDPPDKEPTGAYET
jgi:hypothetical protein